MKRKDFELLKKVLARTTSENDGEALTSLRMASKIMERNGVTWERFLDFTVRVDVEQDPSRPAPFEGQGTSVHRPPPRPSPQKRHFEPDDLEDDPSPRDEAPSGLDQATINGIEAAFRRLEAVQAHTNFTRSLEAQWTERHYLSAEQLKWLWKAEARSHRG